MSNASHAKIIKLQCVQFVLVLFYDALLQTNEGYTVNKIILAVLLAAASTAQAAPVTVTITVQGAQDVYSMYGLELESNWSPSASLEAKFTGEDLNSDNVITQNELSSLTVLQNGVWTYDFTAPEQELKHHFIQDFNYRSAQDYSFRASIGFVDSWSMMVTSGFIVNFSNTSQQWVSWNDAGANTTWSRTNDSLVSVVSSVPEPTTYAMLGLGLAVIGLNARRRRNAASR